jgi:hypothetical protein
VRARLIAPLLALAALAGCGGDDDEPAAPAPAPTTTQAEPAQPAPSETEPRVRPAPEQERRERTPRSLAGCIRERPGIAEVIVKGRESEDATYFEDLVGGRVDVLGVTPEGEGAEHTVFLFADAAAARKAAPGAGGGGVEVRERGSALVVAPPRADTGAIDGCLAATGYARG